ncbi:MAG: response regulator [Blastocatellia bacterium]
MRKLSILLVEDSSQMRRAIKSSLRNLCANFIELSDGAGARAAYAEHQPDWVLMDLQMKEVDGLVATSQITAAYPDARIVIVTNFDDVQLRDAARAAGAFEYVVKDNLLPLRQIISKVTDQSG